MAEIRLGADNGNMKIQQIGTCIGCEARGRIDDGVCNVCLSHPHRGRKWALVAQRVRKDAQFALAIYTMIKTPEGRKMFVNMFGLPDGANELVQERPGLRLVN